MWNIGSLSFERLHAPVARGKIAFALGLSSLLRAKREPEKHPLLSKRGRHEKGATRPFQTPKGLSKPKNASRFAKRIFWASPVYGSADGVTLSQNFTFSKGVKSAAKQQIGETRKKR